MRNPRDYSNGGVGFSQSEPSGARFPSDPSFHQDVAKAATGGVNLSTSVPSSHPSVQRDKWETGRNQARDEALSGYKAGLDSLKAPAGG